ncbi:MAG: site-2 protease family protein [Armatimonadota bacterium]
MVVETVVALILVFGTLVLFHELGHFAAAKLVGIRVEEFAFGWGPRLFRFLCLHGTDYTIHVFPLGGFVKLAGMEPGQEYVADGFQAQPVWKRAVVVFAGPLMSFVLAVVVIIFVGVYWGFPDLDSPENRVGQVYPQTEARRIGLQAGDRIVRIDNLTIRHGKQMTQYIHDRPGQRVRLYIERDGRKIIKEATPQWVVSYLGATWSFMLRDRAQVEGVADRSEARRCGIEVEDVLLAINDQAIHGGQSMIDAIESIGFQKVRLLLMRNGRRTVVEAKPDIQWVAFAGAKWVFPGGVVEGGEDGVDISPSSTAGRAGVRRGDKILSIDSTRVRTGEEFLRAIRGAVQRKKTVRVIVKREGAANPVVVFPTARECVSVRHGYFDALGLLGFMPAPSLEKAGFGESVVRGFREFGERTVYLFRVLTSKRVAQDVGGPVMIAKVTASSVRLGVYYVVDMAAMLSLSLAVVNLVPIPVLDGGHLLILLIEAVRRKRLSPQHVQAIMLAGFTTIVILIILIVYLDVFRIVQGLVPK